jgi:hypothetical protein
MTGICDRILAVDRRIGFVMVVNENGEVVESMIRGRQLMPDEHIATYTGLWTSIIRGIIKQMEKFLGSHQFYSLGYDKLTVHGIPLGDNTIVITARKDLPLEIVLSLRRIAEAQDQTRTRQHRTIRNYTERDKKNRT